MNEFDITGPLPTGTVVLEASAGTGKTYTITALALRYLADGAFTIGELMMVTFSRAATRELRWRVLDRLRGAVASLTEFVERGVPANDPVDALLCHGSLDEVRARVDRLDRAITDSDSALITTTHEFCQRMLTELGFLVDHDPTAVMQDDLAELVGEVVRDQYLRHFPHGEQPFSRMLQLGEAAALHHPEVDLLADLDGLADPVVEFVRDLRADYERRKRRLGVYTFDDMVLRLRAALRDPQTGAQAAATLSGRFPVVMIDEFQDTDPVQWEIVSEAFVGRSTVVLIGDPKQAIYAFRGADVVAYIDALTSGAAELSSLATNHRSDYGVVAGISQILNGAALGLPEITVGPVRAARSTSRLLPGGGSLAPVQIRCIADPDAEGAPDAPLRRNEATDRVTADVASTVIDLLSAGHRIDDDGTERALRPGDIAILVRYNNRGRGLAAELGRRGVRAIFSGGQSVFASEAAAHWLTLLQALADPGAGKVFRVCLSPIVGWSLQQYAAFGHGDDQPLSELVVELRRLDRILDQQGATAVFERLCESQRLGERLLSAPEGDRLFTDLRHLAQLLDAAAPDGPETARQLAEWLDRRIRHTAADSTESERLQRLDSDQDAVRVLTVHRAKGLEFPVVLLPEAAIPPYRGDNTAFGAQVVRDPERRRRLSVGVEPGRVRLIREADQEDLNEELRVLYVAMTRAKSLLVMWWQATDDATRSPLHRLLFGAVPGEVPPAAVPLRGAPTWERFDPAVVSIVPAANRIARAEPPRGDDEPLQALPFDRVIDQTWRRTSYSALTAGVHDQTTLAHPDDAPTDGGVSDEPVTADEFIAAVAMSTDVAAEPTDVTPGLGPTPFLALPGGTDFGTLVHAVLESVEPAAADLPGEVAAQVRAVHRRLPVEGVGVDVLTDGLLGVLTTPLDGLSEGRTLADFGRRDRLTELDFELPLRQRPGDTATLAGIADLLRSRELSDGFGRAYATALLQSGLGSAPLTGFLTGSIDAVLRDAGPDGPRFHVVDYKTNRLPVPPGEELRVGHYTRAAMAEEMIHAHYPLQALLYSVALHRYLAWRLPGYSPTAHLGGIGYLFVRAMTGPGSPLLADPETGASVRPGVFTWHPAPELVTAVSRLLTDRTGGAA